MAKFTSLISSTLAVSFFWLRSVMICMTAVMIGTTSGVKTAMISSIHSTTMTRATKAIATIIKRMGMAIASQFPSLIGDRLMQRGPQVVLKPLEVVQLYLCRAIA